MQETRSWLADKVEELEYSVKENIKSKTKKKKWLWCTGRQM